MGGVIGRMRRGGINRVDEYSGMEGLSLIHI